MSEKFAGMVEIQDSTTQPKVRVALSGENGSAQFGERGLNKITTRITDRTLAIGRKWELPRPDPPILPPVLEAVAAPFPSGPAEPGVAAAMDDPLAPNSVLLVGGKDSAGGITVFNNSGAAVMQLNGATTTLTIGGAGSEGEIILRNANGDQRIRLEVTKASLTIGGAGDDGDIIILDATGAQRIRLDGNSGDIKLLGADCAEEFDVVPTEMGMEPGTVMIIDESSKLCTSNQAYDKKVAGVVSGAGDYRPGIILGKSATPSPRLPIALVGRVFCKVDASASPIAVGDLLTTAVRPGYAMKAADPVRAFGAVLGKALRPLASGQGLIPILIALQ